MKLVVVKDAEAVGLAAAERVTEVLGRDPRASLALPTGESPMGMYEALVRGHRAGGLSFAQATTFNLDEYVGLGPEDAQSCCAFMEAQLFRHVDLDRRRVHLLDGLAGDLEAECARYERELAAAGGVDLGILGIGANGHVGFNEPGTPLDSRTSVLALAERTLVDNARLYPPGTVLPVRGLTMGLGTVLAARGLVLLAFGPRKAEAIRAAVEGPVSEDCPASVLQRHPNATVLLDRAAAARLGRS